MPTNERIREWAEHPTLLLVSRIVSPLATAGVLALVAMLWQFNERLVRVETRLAATNEAVVVMGDAVLRNTERISQTEGNRFTASDGVALEARVNDRIDDSFDRLQELIELLREDVRALRENPP